jgi:hypothetical protein
MHDRPAIAPWSWYALWMQPISDVAGGKRADEDLVEAAEAANRSGKRSVVAAASCTRVEAILRLVRAANVGRNRRPQPAVRGLPPLRSAE